MSTAVCIDISGLVCQSGNRTTLDIPRLQIQPGERVAIIGHNGAGKSTLLRVLTGFTPLQQGKVQVLGRNITQLKRRSLRVLRAEIGQVLQGVHLVERLNVIDNTLIGCLSRVPGWRSWLRQFPPAEMIKAESALRDVGMLTKATARADSLSGGERQKVAIARMLLQSPSLILADEPTAALDPLAAAEICSLLTAAARGATLISVVHNPALLPTLAERVIGLRQGRLVFDLPVDRVDTSQLTRLYQKDAHLELGATFATAAGVV